MTEPGELTHINMWGKYCISSINRNQYYVVFVDDHGQFTSLDFTKLKEQAIQSVKNYITCLKTLMLVELARAMINAHELPEFLWELAIAHVAYLRNRAFTSPLGGYTPYKIWHNNKPNVAHLGEFGAPVWILHQGQANN